MVVSIRLPESNSSYRKRRYSTRFFRKLLLAAVVVSLVLLLWVLGGDDDDDDDEPITWDLGEVKSGLTSLVIVTCHAVWLGGKAAGEEESEWAINDFQKGETKTFIKHIETGVDIALKNPESLLIFSGGETKASTGPRSEGSSYFNLAASRDLIPPSLLQRTTTEESAMDSYQNVLFSICRFHEVTGNYPSSITVISHEFKRTRFQVLHRAAIRFPEEAFSFVGIDPEWESDGAEGNRASILAHEKATREAWSEDLYACNVEGELRVKRRGRNPSRRWAAYGISCPEVGGLLRWCGGGGDLYSGRLPWSN